MTLAEEMNALLPAWTSYQLLGRAPQQFSSEIPKGSTIAFALQCHLGLMFSMWIAKIWLPLAMSKWYWDAVLAGTGYAMKNANTDLPPYADQQLSLTNDQDGVAHELKTNFFIKVDNLANSVREFVFSLCLSRPSIMLKSFKNRSLSAVP